MDQIKLKSKFTTDLVSTHVSKALNGMMDMDINLNLRDIDLEILDDKVQLNIKADATLNSQKLIKLF
jgi:hypothetical protein